jgi:nifR3 family TIM-barrel protein
MKYGSEAEIPIKEQERVGAFCIGDILIDPPVVLAPMADVTNGAFRRLCKRIGNPGLLCTEQISTMALHYRSQRTYQMFDWTEEEFPLSVQLFGADPQVMAEAARIVADRGANIIDINMGCWVPKVCRQGAGAALLRDSKTALKVVQAVVQAVSIPVTVKMRAGWSAAELTSVPLAYALEQVGVQAFALHGRTAQQGFEGSADWNWIAAIKEAVNVPVIGNGDVRLPDDARRMLEATGCDAVMIGRAAIGNPWVLRDTAHYLRTGEYLTAPSLAERLEAALIHVQDFAQTVGEERAVRHLRGQLPHYVKGFAGASIAREQIVQATRIEQVRAILEKVKQTAETEN